MIISNIIYQPENGLFPILLEFVDGESKQISYDEYYKNKLSVGDEIELNKPSYLCCHGDVSPKISPFVKHLISTEGYDRVLAGHIHVPTDDKDFISPCTPIPHNFGDHKKTSLVVFDVANNKHTRKYIYEDFLSFQYVKSTEEKKQVLEKAKLDGKHVYVKIRPDKVEDQYKDVDTSAIVDINSLDINPKSALLPFIEKLKNNLSVSIIHQVLEEAKEFESDLNTPNLKFDIQNIWAKNFLSIYDLDLDMTKFHGLTTIVGKNGAGKSTLFQLIRFILEGKLKGLDKSDYSLVNKGKLEVGMELIYEDYLYKIERTLSGVKFYSKPLTEDRDWIDTDLVDSNNKSDLQAEIESKLKFIKFMNILYISQSSKGIFASMSESNRVSFLGKLIGLSLISKWTSLLKSKISGLNSDQDILCKSIAANESQRDNLHKFIEENKEYSQKLDVNEINEQISKFTEELNSLNSTLSNYKMIELSHDTLISNIEKEKNSINSYELNISSYSKKHSDLTTQNEALKDNNFDLASVTDEMNKKSSSIPSLEKIISDKNDELLGVKSNIRKVKDELDHIKNHPQTCPTCNQEWKLMSDEDRDKFIQEKSEQLSVLLGEEDKINTLISNLKSNVSNLNNEISAIKSSIMENQFREKEYHSNLQTIQQISELIDSQKKSLEQSKLVLDSLTQKLSKFSKESINKLIDETSSKINESNSQINLLNQKLGQVDSNNKIYEKIVQYQSEYDSLVKTIGDETESLKTMSKIIDELEKFNNKVFTDKGLLVATLLNKVSDSLNHDELLKVETINTQGNGVPKPTLNIKLYVEEYDTYIDYDRLSGGQKLQADLRFLSGLTDSLGSISFMMMDETFKFFDDESIMESAEILKTMNTKNIFLIIHGVAPESFSNNILEVTLTDKGSKYEKIY
jgi:DNA repair exonuclease SbcCD ATPase subunit